MQDAPYRLIPAKKVGGEVVYSKISPEDYEWASKHNWRINGGGYVKRNGSRDAEGHRPDVILHRVILGLEKGNPLTGDHINRDRLDNRRENLRAVTLAENNRNIPACSGSTSRHRGVCWYAKIGKWRAAAEFEHVATHLGDFSHEDDGARAVNAFWVERGYPAPNEV